VGGAGAAVGVAVAGIVPGGSAWLRLISSPTIPWACVATQDRTQATAGPLLAAIPPAKAPPIRVRISKALRTGTASLPVVWSIIPCGVVPQDSGRGVESPLSARIQMQAGKRARAPH
jgi:hypothetical protein